MIADPKMRRREIRHALRSLRSGLYLNDLCAVGMLRQDLRQGLLDRGFDLAQTVLHIERGRKVGYGVLGEYQIQRGEILAVECEWVMREGVADLFLYGGVLRRCQR